MIRQLLRPQTLACALVAVGALAMGAAWKAQDRASDLLAEARAINEATVPESETDAPSPEVNREIINNLDRAVVVRAEIDRSLQEILELVRGVDQRQRSSRELLAQASDDLSGITLLLDHAVAEASGSSTGLRRTTGDLKVSRRLARLIAEELEELDRKLGPTLP